MNTVKVKFKRTHEKTPVPQFATDGSVAVDLVAVDAKIDYDHGYIQYSTGLHIAIPEGYGAFLFPRSSISKTPHSLANSVGVIDYDYRGELLIRMRFNEYNCSPENANEDEIYRVGDRICQMIIMKVPKVEYTEVDDLDDTERGTGGFGSTGR